MIRTAGLIAGHYECRSFGETIPVLTDILALQVSADSGKEKILKHPNTAWRLIAHEGGADAPDKPLRNHYGVRVATNVEVDHAFEYLESKKKDYRIKIIKPKEYHNAYSVHFYEPGGNFWEIESYENAVKLGMGKTTDPHWKELLGEERFPGKGYVPQALTHGTIEVDDLEATQRFYQQGLGLEVVRLWPSSIYLKHPSTPWYIVNLRVPKENRVYIGKHQRFTLSVETRDEVKQAHEELKAGASEFRITQLEDVRENSQQASFLLCDLNNNWWEITSLQ
jgi:hypothetical protein